MPSSIVEAMANNEILQIVVFSIFIGVAATALGERGKQLVAVADQVAHVMLKITGYVMQVAPLAVFAAVAATVTTQGLGILVTYGKFIGGFYLCLVVLWLLLVLAGFAVPRPARHHADALHPRAVPAGVLHRELGGRLSRRRSSSSSGSACRTASSASCCRWATRSISTAP